MCVDINIKNIQIKVAKVIEKNVILIERFFT